jgi:hypothetical protein
MMSACCSAPSGSPPRRQPNRQRARREARPTTLRESTLEFLCQLKDSNNVDSKNTPGITKRPAIQHVNEMNTGDDEEEEEDEIKTATKKLKVISA